ncbi:hypothetical protein HCA58_00920 [Micromonospora sp. HNM0581]|uniref:DUF4190 domain-containing protein n=1 Tax=Micromonospora sp. HNM0581 TaxID=2716341 RepID=UPI00146DB8EA|nr:DUF4190 domain-containing protein [Micromonospora sp. HNM0581]NLU76976.1 hypothetical protein [Micromonospora sp. HNM0581]
MQPGHPGQDPYGQHPPYGYPTTPQPTDPYAPSASPYGQPTDPYAQQPPAYGQPGHGQLFADPYAPQPYGGMSMYPNAGFSGAQGQQNTLGLIAMILGIASIPLSCCHLGIPLGVAALVTGWLGRQKADQGLAGNSGQAITGLVCGAVGLLLGLLQIVAAVLELGLSLYS